MPCPNCGKQGLVLCGPLEEKVNPKDHQQEWLCAYCWTVKQHNGWVWVHPDLLPYSTPGLDKLYAIRSKYYYSKGVV